MTELKIYGEIPIFLQMRILSQKNCSVSEAYSEKLNASLDTEVAKEM